MATRPRMKRGSARTAATRRQSMETRLTAACDVVNDDPDVSAAFVVLPRRLRSSVLGSVDGVQQSRRASLERHDDGGVEIVVGDSPDALSPPTGIVPAQRPRWVTRLKRAKAGAP